MNKIIDYLKGRTVHTPGLALARFLLAFSMLLTVLFNDVKVVANHDYGAMPTYGMRHTIYRSIPFKKADLFMVMDPSNARIVVAVILLLVMSGFLPRVTGVLHFWACFSVHNYFMITNGGDDIAFVMSLLLLPICLTDPRINQWKRGVAAPARRNITANIALLMIQVQAAYIYVSAGYEKLVNKQWLEGTAVYYYTSHIKVGAPAWLQYINETVTLTPMVKVLTWGVLGFEFLIALCLFFPSRIKKKLLIPALIFHLLIVFNFGLISFFFSIAGMLVLYLGEDIVVFSSPRSPRDGGQSS